MGDLREGFISHFVATGMMLVSNLAHVFIEADSLV